MQVIDLIQFLGAHPQAKNVQPVNGYADCAAYGVKPGQGAQFRMADGLSKTLMASDPTMQKIDAWKENTPV